MDRWPKYHMKNMKIARKRILCQSFLALYSLPAWLAMGCWFWFSSNIEPCEMCQTREYPRLISPPFVLQINLICDHHPVHLSNIRSMFVEWVRLVWWQFNGLLVSSENWCAGTTDGGRGGGPAHQKPSQTFIVPILLLCVLVGGVAKVNCRWFVDSVVFLEACTSHSNKLYLFARPKTLANKQTNKNNNSVSQPSSKRINGDERMKEVRANGLGTVTVWHSRITSLALTYTTTLVVDIPSMSSKHLFNQLFTSVTIRQCRLFWAGGGEMRCWYSSIDTEMTCSLSLLWSTFGLTMRDFLFSHWMVSAYLPHISHNNHIETSFN